MDDNVQIICAKDWVAKIKIGNGDEEGKDFSGYEQLLFFLVTTTYDHADRPCVEVDAMLSCGTMQISEMGNDFEGYHLRSSLPKDADIMDPS